MIYEIAPLENVIAVLDSGQDAESDTYFVVMERAEKSLQNEIIENGPVDESKAIKILLDIAKGLSEVIDIVHRDLKPANVLYHNGTWKVADFGIARFVEDSTSLNTVKDFLSAPYASPEQWKLEHSTNATDIYALGCIAYFLISGHPPFHGPSREDYRDQHLHEEPPSLGDVSPQFRTQIATALRKFPQSRQSIERVIRVLSNILEADETENQNEGLQALAAAGAHAVETDAKREAEMMREEAERHEREQLHETSLDSLEEIVSILEDRIQEAAPTLKRTGSLSVKRILFLGKAELQLYPVGFGGMISAGSFAQSGWDVLSGFVIEVGQSSPNRFVWGANLWYTNLGKFEGYRWWEIKYFAPMGDLAGAEGQPFAVGEWPLADEAAAKSATSVIRLAAKPLPVDDEDLESFCDRWASLLAQAYNGELRQPTHLPMK